FRLLQEIYGRCLKPNHTLLKSGRDNTVYGELMPIFLERLFNEANLVEDSVFLDLGSGAGNTVAQAALTHRCRSFGIEIRRDVAAIAETMVRTAIVRSEIWGIPIGKMEVVCGDMLQSAEVIEWINTADLVLVNNRIFPSSLNEKIKNLIKTMKLGAVLISLVSFQLCGVNRSGAARKGTDDVGAMFEVRQSHYSSDDISWSSKGGNYYVHTKIR
ncbi:histone methylation DOT1, partial [Lentinula edodes]|uniref:histone methylation DOT1 n=1 Tax=Lentinula edodes TaxID=5353 RepID=UPI001E8DAD33